MKIRVSAALKAKLTAWFASQSMLTFHIQTDSLDEAQNPGAVLGDSKTPADAAAAAASRRSSARSELEAGDRMGAWQRLKRWFSGLCIHNTARAAERTTRRARRSPSSESRRSNGAAQSPSVSRATPLAASVLASTTSTTSGAASNASASGGPPPGGSQTRAPAFADRKLVMPHALSHPQTDAGLPPAVPGTAPFFAPPTIRPHPIPAMPLLATAPSAAATAFQSQSIVAVGGGGRRPSSITSRYFPREVWVAVYRFLAVGEFATAAATCRLMQSLSADRAVWRGITDLRLMGNKMPYTHQLGKVFDRLPHLTTLDFSSFSGPVRRRLLLNSDAVLAYIARACPQLVVLNLYGFNVSDAGVQGFAKTCTQLTELYLSQSTITDKGLNAIVNACRLKRLSLAHCRQLTDDGLRCLGDALELTQLSLSDTALTDAAVRTGVVGCHALTTLYLSFTLVTDIGLRLLSSLPALTALQLQCCTRISDTGVWDVANLCRTLSELDISGNPQLTDDAIAEFESSPVRRLALSSCPNISLAARTAIAINGVAVFDDVDFCSELVEAEVAAEVYNKLELLAMADGYASVAEFVRVYMAAFLDQHQNASRPNASATAANDAAGNGARAAPPAAKASPFPTGVGTSAATPMPRNYQPPALPSHHLTPSTATTPTTSTAAGAAAVAAGVTAANNFNGLSLFAAPREVPTA